MNEPTYTHRVTFRPLDFYFFGGELTFGNGGEVNYFAKTQPYPQQTTLLGVLRHLGYHAAKNIGKSFSHEATATYGFIEALSPLFLTRSGTDYIFGPLYHNAQDAQSPAPAEGRQWLGNQWVDLPILPKLDYKAWSERLFLTKDNGPLFWSEFATTSERIGIIKQNDERDNQDGFYKQEVGHLKRGVAFACLANFPEGIGTIASTTVLGVGGEKARFAVQIEPLGEEEPDTFSDLFPAVLFAAVASPHYHSAVLLSDAYVDQQLFNDLPFAVAGIRDFRYLSTPTGVQHWGRFKRHGQNSRGQDPVIEQSRKLNLLERGSILYANSATQLHDLLNDNRWRAIGYNHFHSFDKTSAK